jgi:hypothetical protein
MLHSHHTAGSPAAQANLAVLAGWAPSRRRFLGSLLVAASATTTAGTAAALVVQTSAPAAPGVSPDMAALIADFQALDAALDAAEHSDEIDAWDVAADARGHALEALVFERPATLTDFAAKMTALARFMADEDSDLFAFRRLAEDAATLAGEVAE